MLNGEKSSMKQTVQRILSIFVFLIIIGTGINTTIAQDVTNLEQFLNDKSIRDLDGDWYAFPKELLTTEEVRFRLQTEDVEHVTLPNSFETLTGEVNSYATYSIKLEIPESYLNKTLAVHIPFQYSAYKLFMNDVEIAETGEVGTNVTSHVSEMAPQTGYFIPHEKEFYLTMQVSSFDHIRGGFENSISIGKASEINRAFNNKIITALFLNGSIFIIGLFMFIIALFRRQEFIFFVFGLFAMFISIRSLFAVPFIYTLIFPHMSWVWGTRLEYMLTILTSMLFIILLWKWHEKEFSKKVMYYIVVVHLLVLVATLFTQPLLFQNLFFKVFMLAIPVFLYNVYVIYRSILNHNKYAIVNLIGLAVIFLAFFNDFAIGQGLYTGESLMLIAVAIYVLIHVVFMSRQFANSLTGVEQLNERLMSLNLTLDKKVATRTRELKDANAKLKYLALYDGLTDIANRRYFNEYIENIDGNFSKEKMPVSLCMIDVDQFKLYNDYYGHLRGDRLLRDVVLAMKKEIPKQGFFARYGGEEFVLVLPKTEKKRAYEIAENIRQAVEDARFEHEEGKFGIVTVSIGVANFERIETTTHMTQLVSRADKQLYEAKEAGRNKVR